MPSHLAHHLSRLRTGCQVLGLRTPAWQVPYISPRPSPRRPLGQNVAPLRPPHVASKPDGSVRELGPKVDDAMWQPVPTERASLVTSQVRPVPKPLGSRSWLLVGNRRSTGPRQPTDRMTVSNPKGPTTAKRRGIHIDPSVHPRTPHRHGASRKDRWPEPYRQRRLGMTCSHFVSVRSSGWYSNRIRCPGFSWSWWRTLSRYRYGYRRSQSSSSQ